MDKPLPVKILAPELVTLLHSSDGGLRWWAAEALVKIRHPHAMKFLLEALKSDQLAQRSRAIKLLSNRVKTPQVINCFIEALSEDSWLEAWHALVAMGAPAVGPLIKALDDPKRATHIIGILKKIGDARAVPALIRALRDPLTCTEAAEALGSFDDPRAARALKQALKRGDLKVIYAAHEFFIRQGREGTQRLLIRALHAIPRQLRHHDGSRAYHFIRSGNPRLAAAGRRWDRRYGDGNWSHPRPEEKLLASIFGKPLESVRWGSARLGCNGGAGTASPRPRSHHPR